MRKLATVFTSAALIFGLMVSGASAQDVPAMTEPPPGDGVALAIYNVGTALVQDRRTFTFQEGLNTLNFTDVAAGIDPTSVTFVSLTDPTGTVVLEQNYVYDLVNSAALISRYVDQKITVITTDGTEYNGTLLSGNGGDIILRQDDGQVIVVSPANIRDIRFPNLPGGLITRPTLRWVIQASKAGEQQVELTYLTSGMNWAADYNLLLAHDNQSLDLNGWVTLNNSSGGAYTDANVKLVAGDVNRLPQPMERGIVSDMLLPQTGGGAPPVEQRDFNEYKLYAVSRPVTVAANETKQVEFVSAAHIAAQTFFVYDSSQPYYAGGSPIIDQYYGQNGVTTVANYLSFNTGEESGLGVPLPAGNIRVYQQDVDGSALLVGENSISHTPKGEDVQLLLGNAFDLVGSRTQTNFNLIAGNVLEETYEIHLRNHKENDAVEIRVPEHLFRWSNWEIVNSSMDYTKKDSNTIEFRANVPANGETVIKYTVRYTWPR